MIKKKCVTIGKISPVEEHPELEMYADLTVMGTHDEIATFVLTTPSIETTLCFDGTPSTAVMRVIGTAGQIGEFVETLMAGEKTIGYVVGSDTDEIVH